MIRGISEILQTAFLQAAERNCNKYSEVSECIYEYNQIVKYSIQYLYCFTHQK